MNALEIILIILALVGGFFFGKYVYDRAKWSDKRKSLDSDWELKLQKRENKHQEELNKFKEKILEIKKDNQEQLSNLKHDWEMKYSKDLSEIKEMIKSSEKYMRHDAIKRSKRTLLGKLWEQVSPYLPKFPFKPSDMKFLGSPIDFIIFDGASENDIKQVIFLEVKSGESKLSTQERKLKKAIDSGKVRWEQFNVDKPEEIKFEEQEEKDKYSGEVKPHELYNTIDKKINKLKILPAKNNKPQAGDKVTFFCPSCDEEIELELEEGDNLKVGFDADCASCGETIHLDEEDLA